MYKSALRPRIIWALAITAARATDAPYVQIQSIDAIVPFHAVAGGAARDQSLEHLCLGDAWL